VSGQFSRGPMDVGFAQTPHGLWNLEVSTGARCVLGWLHSHTDQFLASVTCNMMRRVFNTSSIKRWLDELAEAGFVSIVKGGAGTADHYHLETEPWVALHQRRRHRAETGAPKPDRSETGSVDRAETGAPMSAPIGHQSEDITSDPPVLPSVASQQTPEPSGRGVRANAACRPSNPLFDALVVACGMAYDEMTEPARKRTGVAAAQLARVGATPDEVHRRAEIYRQVHTASLTPTALSSQWAACREVTAPAARQDSLMERARALRAQQERSNVVEMGVAR